MQVQATSVAPSNTGSTNGQPQKRLFSVLLPWSNSGNPADEEGTYATTVWAADEEEAVRLVAEEMAAESNQFAGEKDDAARAADIADFVQSRREGWSEVVSIEDAVESDLAELYAQELFPDGVKRGIDMGALRALVRANRERLVIQSLEAGSSATCFKVGLRVRTLHGEQDTDETGNERRTPPGTWGSITNHNHADHWDVVFEGGGWVVLTEAEMLNHKDYQLETTAATGQ